MKPHEIGPHSPVQNEFRLFPDPIDPETNVVLFELSLRLILFSVKWTKFTMYKSFDNEGLIYMETPMEKNESNQFTH